MIKKIVYNVFIKLSNFLVKHTKKQNIILFNSFPDLSDNAIYLYNYIIKNRPDLVKKYRLVWVTKQLPNRPGKSKMEIVLKRSIKGYWFMLHSKYIVATHGFYYGYVSANGQTIVNLWHGCGYKGMTQNDTLYRNGDYNIVTGSEFIESHSKAFRIKRKNILVTGLPRNDALFENNRNALYKLGIEKNNYKKIIIWMPTYRKAKMGHDTLDGDIAGFGAYTINKNQYNKLDSLLKEKEYLLIIKPHPMDSASAQKTNGLTNVRCISNEQLDKSKVALYSLLTETDALLSDYSSVIVDYLLLDKPITLVMSDKESYKNSRGYTFDNIEDYNPGPTISDFSSLYRYFEHMDETDRMYIDKRHSIARKLHKYHDGKSCKRVCDAIWGEPRKKN